MPIFTVLQIIGKCQSHIVTDCDRIFQIHFVSQCQHFPDPSSSFSQPKSEFAQLLSEHFVKSCQKHFSVKMN